VDLAAIATGQQHGLLARSRKLAARQARVRHEQASQPTCMREQTEVSKTALHA